MLLPVFFMILLSSASVNIVLANTPITFCSRARASKSCPTPPTFDSVNLQAYLGHWYEIGSTASFKLLTESGLVCDQAQYSAASGNVSLLNSGLKVIGPLAIAEIGAVSLAAGGVCTGARDICYDLAPSSGISQALYYISNAKGNLTKTDAALLSQISQKLRVSLEATEMALQVLADNIKQVQQLNSQLSQANASLPESINAIKSNVSQASQEQAAISNLVGELSEAQSQTRAISKKLQPDGKEAIYAKQELEQATSSLTEAAVKIATINAAMGVSLGGIKAGAATLSLNEQPISNAKVSSVQGGITQNASSPGKLEVSINGVKAPYWILQVQEDGRGGYGAALVYSCREIAGLAAKSLFILSREPYLDEKVVEGFLKQAELYGIYNDCDDPFLFTVQRGGNCGNST